MIKNGSFHSFKVFFLVFFLVLIVHYSINASTVRDTFQKNIEYHDGGFLSLSNSNGDIEIKSWDKDEIEIIAYKKVKADDRETAEKLMERLKIDIQERDGGIIVETLYPKGGSSSGLFGWLFGGGHGSIQVEYEIKVPQEIDLNIHTTNGGVNIEEIEGRLRLESTNGRIDAREIKGLTKCKTTNGNIKVEFDDVREGDEMTFKTTNGSIDLYLPEDYGADDVNLKTTNGHIDCDFPMSGSSSRRSKKKFRGSINDGDRELTCSTTNGSIRLRVND